MTIIYSTHALHPKPMAMLESQGEFRVASALDPETLAREGAEAEIVIVRANIPAALFTRQRRLRAAIRHGAGLDMIPVDAATVAGVLVANVPGANAVTVAEYVTFASLALLRRFRFIDTDLRSKGWLAGRSHAESAGELGGRTIGIIGMGNIGRAIAAAAMGGFGMRVLGHSRRNAGFPEHVTPVSLDELLAQSDIVVLACPLTEETRGMIGATELARMRTGALLINVSRGPVVVEADLVSALHSGRLGGAALDVFATQPLPADHPFFGFANVILTPHLAGITEEAMERMGTVVAQETIRILAGRLPVNLVNPEAVPRYRQRFPE
ncbi:MAG: NAD(P)-dependent oxidoreductase [Hyphomicrobiales bacterium]